jgi:S-adenosylmethionine hydrolase
MTLTSKLKVFTSSSKIGPGYTTVSNSEIVQKSHFTGTQSSPLKTITLTTDFGSRDEYVGVMKGVMIAINPDIHIIDLSHGIEPFNIAQAARLLSANYRYFPDGSIHVVVVDPGVGSNRHILALIADNHLFIGPDNGIFTPFLKACELLRVHRITNHDLFLKPPSTTFHGRDIMAPVAAKVAAGMAVAEVGEQVAPADCITIAQTIATLEPGLVRGEVISVDRFGNLRTNIDQTLLDRYGYDVLCVCIGDRRLPLVGGSYHDLAGVEAGALINSSGELEICAPRASAAHRLSAAAGDEVVVQLPLSSTAHSS